MSDTALTVLVIAGLSLLPVLLMVLSSFAKFAIVLAVLRNAIGAPGVPPNLVITGLAVVFTGVVLAPVARAIVDETRPVWSAVAGGEGAEMTALAQLGERASGPIRGFLAAHARPEDRRVFADLLRAGHADTRSGARSGAGSGAGSGDQLFADDSLAVLAPAFAVSEMREAFVIAVVVLIPFLIIDLAVSAVLLALGLPGLSVASVSMPLKLLLFVAIDGWRLLAEGLIAGYLPA